MTNGLNSVRGVGHSGSDNPLKLGVRVIATCRQLGSRGRISRGVSTRIHSLGPTPIRVRQPKVHSPGLRRKEKAQAQVLSIRLVGRRIRSITPRVKKIYIKYLFFESRSQSLIKTPFTCRYTYCLVKLFVGDQAFRKKRTSL